MNILMANKFFYRKGGAETVFFQERELLMERGVRVVDFAMQHPQNLPSPYADFFVSHRDYHAPAPPLEKLRLAATFIHNPEAVRKLAALVDREQPQLAHLHNIYHQLTPSILKMLRKKGVRTVVTLHDLKLACPAYVMLDHELNLCSRCRGGGYYQALTTNCQGSLSKSLLLTLEAYYHQLARSWEAVDRFITPSAFLKREVCHARLDPDKVSVIYNGVDLNRFTISKQDQGYALFMGRLSREKGLDTLLAAHAPMADGLELRVAGDGPERQRLEAEYPRARFTGFLSGHELTEMIGNAAFIVVPSEWYENCPMSVIEPMAMGKPVIATDMGGIPELVSDRVTGMLFPQGDARALAEAMRTLADDPALRQRMGTMARKAVEERHSLDGHADQLMALYDSVLQG